MKKKTDQEVYGYQEFVKEMRALPFMTAIMKHRDWERGLSTTNVPYEGDMDKFIEATKKAKKVVLLPPKFTARQWFEYSSNGKHTYEELLKYGPQGRKIQFEEDGVTPKTPGKRGRAKGWKKPVEGVDQLDEFGMKKDKSKPIKEIKQRKIKEPKTVKTSAGESLRIPAMFERGILKKGDKINILGFDKSEAVIVDGSTVKFNKKEMNYNQWAQAVLNHKAVNVYKHVQLNGKLFQELRTVS